MVETGILRKLKSVVAALLLMTGIGMQEQVLAQDGVAPGEAMVKAYRCYACHDVSDPLIGPPYQAIAARHGSDREVMAKVLANKIILGGGGNWGLVPMVPNEQVPPEDALVIARWILDQAPGRN